MNHKKYSWTKEELERLIWEEGLTYLEIAKLYGAKRGSVVRNSAIAYGIKLPDMKHGDFARRRFKRKELEYLIFHEGLTLNDLNKKFNTSHMGRIVRSFGIELPDYKTYVPLKYRVNNINEDGTINNNYLPVPLKYTYPICMKIEIYWKGDNRGKDLLYIPEENKWMVRSRFMSLNNKGERVSYTYWLNRWVVRAKDPENLTEEEVDRLIYIKYNDRLLNTKEYIRNQLLINSKYECDFFCTREDLIEIYPKSRIGKGQFLFNYNFDKVPKFIKTTMEKFEVSYSEEFDGEIISGSFLTCFRNFIKNRIDPIELSKRVNKLGASTRMTNEEFLERAKYIHGDLYEYLDNIDEVRKEKGDKIRIRCKRCGRIFEQDILHHLRGYGCKYCNIKYREVTEKLRSSWENLIIPFEEFVKRSRKIHGDRYEYFENSYTDMRSKTKIRDTITGDIFYQQAYCHCHGSRNPNLHSSLGEDYVEKWLKEYYPDSYQKEVRLIGLVEGRNTNEIRPDFILKVNGVEFWIEYHGKQHYVEMSFFHKTHEDFLKQLKRDQNERNYCNENGIILIEISYEYNTYEKVSKFLEEHIKNTLKL